VSARDLARQAHDRQYVEVLELDLDRCTLTYGVAPCTATGAVGTECRNTYQTCQAKAAYDRGVHTYGFISRGAPIPTGEALRPYIIGKADAAPTIIDLEGGLARSARVRVDLADEPDSDIEQDPYVATRPVPPAGTFWRRLLARNKNYAGRIARVRRGYVVSPWDWDTFQTETYIIDTITGPDAGGKVSVVLKDPLKLADTVKVPRPTDGKLAVELPDYADRGTAQGGSGNTIVLRTEASAVNDYYVGMAVRLDDQAGAGQERVISAYDGPSRTATVSPAFSVAPDATTIYSVHHLQAALGVGQGAQYDRYGYPAWVRLGEELVRITGRDDDTLKWDTSADRVQFSTPLQTHKADEAVQLCKVYVDQAYTDVIIDLVNEAGLDSGYIDTVMFADQDSTWLGADYRVTVPLHTPESVSKYLKELALEAGAAMWWSPAHQKLHFRVIVPQGSGAPPHLTAEASIIDGSLDVRTLDELRLTATAVNYNLRNATANRDEAKNYIGGAIYIDAAAEGPNEYDGERTEVVYSRWFGAGNTQAARNLASRKVDYRRDAPALVVARIDPKDYTFQAGDQVDITTPAIVDVSGQPKKVRILVTKLTDRGRDIAIEGRTTTFAKRYAFIAPDGTPDYPADSDYAHISQNDGLMPDGTSGYLII